MESYIKVGSAATSFVGEDATRLFAATMLRSAIDMYVGKGLRASRAYTPSAMAAAASRYTGKTYKASKASLAQAADDLTQWIEAMKSALPIEREGGR